MIESFTKLTPDLKFFVVLMACGTGMAAGVGVGGVIGSLVLTIILTIGVGLATLLLLLRRFKR
jgi:hypothetical protein